MMWLLGDVHCRMAHVLPAIRPRGDATANVIFLGDIEARRPFEDDIRPLTEAGIGVWFIHGNHYTDSPANWDNLRGSWHRCLHGRVVDIEGVRVVAWARSEERGGGKECGGTCMFRVAPV